MSQADYFLKIDTIPGESEDSKHKGEIDVLSWNWAESNQGAHGFGGGGGAGKVQMSDFSFQMNNSTASGKLIKACALGEHIKEATLTARKAGTEQQEFLIIKFKDLLISNYTIGGQSGSSIPTESISFNFSKIEYTYKKQGADGKLGGAEEFKYDQKANKAY
jgi:type VI secretion system secreted protein Hcp